MTPEDDTHVVVRDVHIDGLRRDVELRAGRIAQIVEHGQASTLGATVRDLDGRLLLPGFVNAHTHLDKALLIETAGAETRFRNGVMEAPMAAAKRDFTVGSVKERARRVLNKAVATGTTAMRTHVDIDVHAGLTGLKAIAELREEYRPLIELEIVAFPQEGLGDEASIALMREALESGADLVGGKPSADQDFKRHVRTVFDLAERHQRGIDAHLDVNMDVVFEATREWQGHRVPAELECVALAIEAAERAFAGELTASHVMALDSLDAAARDAVIALLAKLEINVIVCPSCSLYLHGRGDDSRVRRGIAPVRAMQAQRVPVALASDNTGDAFNLYSGPDMLLHALLTAYTCHMQTVDDLETVMAMATTVPASIMGLDDYGLAAGCWADAVAVDCTTLYDAIVDVPPRHLVLKRGVEVGQSARSALFP